MIVPHCKHCAWSHQHHPDNAPGHQTPCSSGCPGASDQAAIF